MKAAKNGDLMLHLHPSEDWAKERLFVKTTTAMPMSRLLRGYGCKLGATHDAGELRGMKSIRVGFLLASLNALYALID
jgi:hypothetical protein